MFVDANQAKTKPARTDNASAEARPVSSILDMDALWRMLLLWPPGAMARHSSKAKHTRHAPKTTQRSFLKFAV